ncbi:metallopeptidase TldD-related protein [Parasporobacterium paucivorans]|uniref:PmbA protein n=1 Tax=Parasporobacterium paucivorans DSM 15970 TaxID=1122934 RepID=A0A1M6D4C6_9FIRM|nr:metallopeptidase TldD-related protein [Parasporobacterium paucivorans]SHI67944.1 PmbA protein [Parasporobacterium paucivorans DSM 15970]
MLGIIRKILSEEKADAYKITEYRTESRELFLVKKNVDMDRAKNVRHFKVVVYKDFEEEGILYRGSCNTDIHPTMTEEEIRKVVTDALFAAGFVKNPFYHLAQPGEYMPPGKSRFAEGSLTVHMESLVTELYENDIHEKGGINSSEIFLNKHFRRIVNSLGVDVQEETADCMIEFITVWKEEKEETELYKCLQFSDYSKGDVARAAAKKQEECQKKAKAEKLFALDSGNILLTGEAVQSFFEYYCAKSNAAAVYNGESDWKPGDNIQGEILGDAVNISLDPGMSASTRSSGFDEDGFPLRPVNIVEEGVLKRYAADIRYAHYLKVEPTGVIKNIRVKGGTRSIEEMKREPYLEILTFSDFSMDAITGDFGGEIRLAEYFDGKDTIPVTGGSVTGNIGRVHGHMYLSREIQAENDFEGPAAVSMKGINVTSG